MAEHPALVTAARFGLFEHDSGDPVTIGPADVDRVMKIARIDRLGGLLHAAITAGYVVADAETGAAVRDLWHDQLVAAVTVEALAVRTARTLDAAGVVWRLTKGPALAHLDYPDPALRPFGDVDVVVHPASWAKALDALLTTGGRRESAELAPGFDARFGKGATITMAEMLEVDLHRRLAIGRFGVRLPTEALFTDVDIVTFGGRAVPALDGSSRLLHACYHAALGGFRHLRAHRDVAQLLLVTGVDWRSTVAVAEQFRVAAVVARAIDDAWTALDMDVSHPAHAWATATPIHRADAKALAVFGVERPFHDQAMTAVPVLVGRGAAAYMWALTRQPGRGAASGGALIQRARRALRRPGRG